LKKFGLGKKPIKQREEKANRYRDIQNVYDPFDRVFVFAVRRKQTGAFLFP